MFLFLMKLIFATHNPGKIEEAKKLLADLYVEVLSAEEAGVREDVIEDGETFEENALKKARFVSEKTGEWAVADDSGICIDALDGRPGVQSARWAGEGASGEAIIAHTLHELREVPPEKRGASFISALALVAPNGDHWIFNGAARGSLASSPRGSALPQLPYDVIFIPEGYLETFAEMSREEKNKISHRGRAFEALKNFLKHTFAPTQQ